MHKCISNQGESSYYYRGNWYEGAQDSICNGPEDYGENSPRSYLGVMSSCVTPNRNVPWPGETIADKYNSGELWIKMKIKLPSSQPQSYMSNFDGSPCGGSGYYDGVKFWDFRTEQGGSTLIQWGVTNWNNYNSITGGQQYFTIGNRIDDSQWHTLLLRWRDNTDMTLWVDDVQRMMDSLGTTGKVIRWGWGYAHPCYLADSAWMIDNIEIWDRMPTEEPTTCLLPDLNCDSQINSQDFTSFQSFWSSQDSQADFNQDGLANARDFGIMMSKWGTY